MKLPVNTKIDPGKCNGCGECVRVCPSRTIEMRDDRAVIVGKWSLGCGHCAAVCPADAVTVGGLDGDALLLAAVDRGDGTAAAAEFDTAALVGLMRSRRSCRNYLDRPVPRALLEDLARIGTTAPSGTNCQLWTFTILHDRGSVLELGEAVGDFFRRICRKAENPALRLLSKLTSADPLGDFYRNHYADVREGLRLRDEEGRDPLFHGAPSLILVGSRPGGTCPAEDALLASQNILLAAHSLGLGSCMIGFAVEAMKHDPSIGRLLGIPAGERVHAAIAIGWPDEHYLAPAGRRAIEPRFFRPPGD